MSAIGAKPAAGAAMDIPSTIAGIILLLVIVGATYFLVGPGMMFYALIGVIVGGLLIAFGVHFVPVGGAPAAMGQAPGIATGVPSFLYFPIREPRRYAPASAMKPPTACTTPDPAKSSAP